jgi:hypothetical protein
MKCKEKIEIAKGKAYALGIISGLALYRILYFLYTLL